MQPEPGRRLQSAAPLIPGLLCVVGDNPLPAFLVRTGDASGFAKFIDAPLCNAPSERRFLDRHTATPTFLFFKNSITTVSNKINRIIPNNKGSVRVFDGNRKRV